MKLLYLISLVCATALAYVNELDAVYANETFHTDLDGIGEDAPQYHKLTQERMECALNPLRRTEKAWYNATYGFVQGLYHTKEYPVTTGCLYCRALALPVSNFQYTVHMIFKAQEKYLRDPDGMDTLDYLEALFNLYAVLQDFSANFDYMIQQPTTKLIWAQLQ